MLQLFFKMIVFSLFVSFVASSSLDEVFCLCYSVPSDIFFVKIAIFITY